MAPGFEPVAHQFARNLIERGDQGAAFAAFADGRLVIDAWGGVADHDGRRPWQRDTLAGIFSGTKGLVATCLLLLIERGQLDLEMPVCAYWPEFAARGKDEILVRHVVSHQAGLPGITTAVTPEEACDSVRMAGLLANQPALWSPGTRFCYHALTFGWLCGELIRRVDGRTVGQLFHDDLAGPLGLDAWIGLPAEHEDRVAVLERGSGFGSQARDREATLAGDQVAWSIWGNPPRFSSDPMPANTRRWHAAEIPASNGIATARSLARLYGCLARGGELEGIRVLAPRTLEQGRRCLARGVDPYVREHMAFGVGFGLQTEAMTLGPPGIAFGHTGAGGSVHGGWPELKAGFSYVTKTLRESEGPDPRSCALLQALHAALRPAAMAAPATTEE